MTLIQKNINIDLPIFARENYLKSKSDSYGWFVTDDFILPFTIDKKIIFKRLIFSTETIYRKEQLTLEEEKNFLNEVVNYCKEQKLCDFIFKAQANAVFNVYPNAAKQVEWGTYELSLKSTMDEILSKFAANDRNEVRKAIKMGIKVEATTNIEEVYENVKETFTRQNSLLFPSLEYLEKLQKNLLGNIKLFVVRDEEGVLQGSAIIIYDKERAYYLYGGSIPRPSKGSIKYMHYRAMEEFKKEGLLHYDFVGARLCLEKGSKIEAIQKFKKKFGATLRSGYAFRVVIHPLKFMLFKVMVKGYFILKKSSYVDPIDSIRSCSENNS